MEFSRHLRIAEKAGTAALAQARIISVGLLSMSTLAVDNSGKEQIVVCLKLVSFGHWLRIQRIFDFFLNVSENQFTISLCVRYRQYSSELPLVYSIFSYARLI